MLWRSLKLGCWLKVVQFWGKVVGHTWVSFPWVSYFSKERTLSCTHFACFNWLGIIILSTGHLVLSYGKWRFVGVFVQYKFILIFSYPHMCIHMFFHSLSYTSVCQFSWVHRHTQYIYKWRRRGWQRMRWLDGITALMDMSLSKLQN